MINIANIKDYLILIFFFVYSVLLPGYFLARLILPPGQLNSLSGYLPGLERGVLKRYFYYLFAPATGLILLDAAVLILAKFGLRLSFDNFFYSFAIVNLALIILNSGIVKSRSTVETGHAPSLQKGKYTQFYWVFSILFLGSVIIRTIFYLPDVVPQDTDLGHHMYWSQLMVQKETFPNYDTPEVIEGEHMVFAVLSKLSGITLLSALPLIILAAYNLMMILALSFSAMALTGNRKIALWTLFFSGIYFAIDPPQARYVKGGVIGNTFGNLFTVLAFLLIFMFVRYWLGRYLKLDKPARKKIKPALVSLFSLLLVIIAGSFYTHHLSTLLLGITIMFTFVSWIIATFAFCRDTCLPTSEAGSTTRNVVKTLLDFFRKIIFSKKFLLTLSIIIAFPLFVYLPHYLANSAVDTVTQAPIKDTHQGLPLETLPNKAGWLRLIFALGAVVFLVTGGIPKLIEKINLADKVKLPKISLKIGTAAIGLSSLVIGWALPLFILSFYPSLMQIDLPSQRIINYLVLPIIILAAWTATVFGEKLKSNFSSRPIKIVTLALGIALLWEGTGDFRSVYKANENKFQDAVELYSASRYLAEHTASDAQILKDHRTIAGDSWIKFFLLRGYDYLTSRTYDYKYNAIDSKLDPCTREMILVPGSSLSQKCYGQTGINYVIVKPDRDEYLFWKDLNFNTVYLSDSIAIFSYDK